MSQPGSPDVLEELEEEVLKMLDEHDEAEDGTAAEPEGMFDGEADVNAELDPEVANALEEELFGAAGGAASGADSEEPDISETELFGPEAEETPATGTTTKGKQPASTSKTTNEAPTCEPCGPENLANHLEGLSNEDREARRASDEGEYDSKTSRYMLDEKGELLHKWKADYASRGGGGRAQCRDKDCLERFEQGGVLSIEKGCLRIGRRVLMEQDRDSGTASISFMWFHARCIFNSFLRARKSTRIIESEFDIENFALLNHADQETIRLLVNGTEKPSNARFSTGEGIPNQTPAKRGSDGPVIMPSAEKKRRMEPAANNAKPGDRVWTFFRCLPKDGPGVAPGVAGVSVKSDKPELAMIREEPTGPNCIVQFESEDHEKERIELFQSKKGKRIRGWLRYPRLFEGRKQRVPTTWLQLKRNPPALCGCKVQAWGHGCECGISCGRGSMVKVWGVGDTAY